MDKAEILKLSISKLKVAIALALGLAVYDRKIGNDNNAPRYALTEAGDTEIPSGWERVVDIAKVPDVGFITITCDEYWLATRPSSPSYLRSQLKSEDEQERYIDALMELCTVEASLVFYDGVEWADYPGLWRLVNASDEQQMRAWLIAKSCV